MPLYAGTEEKLSFSIQQCPKCVFLTFLQISAAQIMYQLLISLYDDSMVDSTTSPESQAVLH